MSVAHDTAPASAKILRFGRSPSRRILVVAAVIVAVIATGAAWLHARAGRVSTNDARIAADIIAVSSEAAGRIVQLDVKAGDQVRKGQVLVRIEPRDAQYGLAEIDANIANLRAQRAQLLAQQSLVRNTVGNQAKVSSATVDSAQADYLTRQAELAVARSAFQRTEILYGKGLVAKSRFEEDQARLRAAEQAAVRARAAISGAKAGAEVTQTGLQQMEVIAKQIAGVNAQIDALAARREQQRLDLGRRQIVAAFDGVVDQTVVDPGEYVSPGSRILLYHDPHTVWVDVNVKETEFRKLKVGAPAKVKVDAYPGRTFPAKVQRLGGAATSQFALLPNPNPSGNFTKVTQRLPVRLAITQQQNLLRPGMMAEVTIDAAD
ncbi:MAG: HlyD family secretion protein [Pseudomonadota bacterium]